MSFIRKMAISDFFHMKTNFFILRGANLDCASFFRNLHKDINHFS